MRKEIVKFNELFEEFLEKIITAFPNDKLKTYRKGFLLLKITSPNIPVNLFMGIDPASSVKKHADYSTIVVVAVDSKYFRPTEVELLIGDATKAKEKLGWTPKYELQDLVTEMMKSDLKLMQKKQYLRDGGFAIKNYFE